MNNMKRLVALALATTMVMGSALTAFADDPVTSGSSTGTGSSEGHMDKHIIEVTLPTVDEGATPFAYTMDPERLIQATDGGKYADGTIFPAADSDTGVYFLTGSGAGAASYEAVDEPNVADIGTYYEQTVVPATYELTHDEEAVEGKTYYVEEAGSYTEAGDVVLVDFSEATLFEKTADESYVYELTEDEAIDEGKTYYTQTAAAGGATYANSSSVLTASSQSSADVKLTVSVAASSATTDIALVDSAPAANETAAKLYLGLVVNDGTTSTTTPIKAGETVSKEVTIAGKDSNFEASVENGQYKYVAKTGNDITWNSATFNLTGAVSKVSAEGLTAPTLTVTWSYEDPAATPDTYQVTFDTNDGSEVAAQTVEAGGKATRPETDPTKEDDEDYTYDFAGWYADEDCENEFDFDTEINEATTIYAKWTATAIEPEITEPTASANSVAVGGSVNILLPDGVTITGIQKKKTDGSFNALPDTYYTLTDIEGGQKLSIASNMLSTYASATTIKVTFSEGDPLSLSVTAQ